MFSRQTAGRFEKGRESTIGPGSYATPSTLENRALMAEPCNTAGNDLKHDDTINDLTGPLTVLARKRGGMEKENRVPLAQKKKSISRSQSCKSVLSRNEIASEIRQEDVLTSQSTNEHHSVMNEERNNRMKSKENDYKVTASDIKRLNANIESLQERLAMSERDRKIGDHRLLQQQQRTKELEDGLQEHIAVLEESLHREEKKRRELEKRTASEILEKEHGETEFEMERRHVTELQRRVTELESVGELKHVENRKQADELRRAGEQQMDLEMRVARAESDFAAECTKTAALKHTVVDMEDQLKDFQQKLENEQRRSEQMQQRIVFQAGSERTSKIQDNVETTHGLQERVARAEAEAEAASEELQRWKEWADEQALRELTAETDRLEELKRVRENVARQVEAARQEVIEENNELQHRIGELEGGSKGVAVVKERLMNLEQQLTRQMQMLEKCETERRELQACLKQSEADLCTAQDELAETKQHAEEDHRTLEVRAARAEANVAVIADELAEEREKWETQLRDLREKYDTEKLIMSREFEMTQAAEKQVAVQCEGTLKKSLHEARTVCTVNRWQLVTEAVMQQHLMSCETVRMVELRQIAHHWRKHAKGHESDVLLRKNTEIEHLDSEAEILREQNKQMLLSLQQLQQELVLSQAEAQQLHERVVVYEDDVLKMSERNAELGSHSNHKQKIKHLMAVKAENQALREELRRSKQLLLRFEGQQRSAHLFDSAGATPLGSATPRTIRTPTRKATTNQSASQGLTGLASMPDERLEDARHARAHRREMERSMLDYHHLAVLVQQILTADPMLVDNNNANIGIGSVSSGAVTPDTNHEHLSGTANPAVLLQRLRTLSASLMTGKSGNGSVHSQVAEDTGSFGVTSGARCRDELKTPRPKGSSAATTPRPRD